MMLHKLYMLTALGFGSGKIPKAPGTFGTLAAVIPVILTSASPYWVKAIVFFIMLVLGTAASQYHGTYTGLKDASEVVIDEIAAYYMIFLFFPVNTFTLVMGFILFRIFDILKPYPIKNFEKLDGGVGVMMDDIIAGFYTIICLAIVYFAYIMFFAHK
ncbi:MAG: phosphatidylglycerophosphatase A [Denitrovibrio sp.]|nr:MAG: phosphatidylglycerophosphatase A [Denitrovibrio sp.]